MYTFGLIPSKVRCICTKSSISVNLARGWTWENKGNSSLEVISCVNNLWPNDYSQPPDICLIQSYNRAFPIVQWVKCTWLGNVSENIKLIQYD